MGDFELTGNELLNLDLLDEIGIGGMLSDVFILLNSFYFRPESPDAVVAH